MEIAHFSNTVQQISENQESYWLLSYFDVTQQFNVEWLIQHDMYVLHDMH